MIDIIEYWDEYEYKDQIGLKNSYPVLEEIERQTEDQREVHLELLDTIQKIIINKELLITNEELLEIQKEDIKKLDDVLKRNNIERE